MTENDWKDNTSAISNFEIDIAFFTRKEYYFGDDNDTKQIAEQNKYSVSLYIPFADKDLLVTSKILTNNQDEIIKYYQSVINLSEKHNKKLSHSYFWIRPFIRNLETNKVLVGFPWFDTLTEIRRLFLELNQETQGNIFFDADQSWQLIIDNYKGQIFIKEFDPDENEIYCQISIDRQSMIEQKDKLLLQTEEIINNLTEYFGKDYWTKRI